MQQGLDEEECLTSEAIILGDKIKAGERWVGA